MTNEDRYEITVLAEEYETKKMRFEMLGLLNAHGKTPDERIKMSIEYHLAQTEMNEAWHKLNDAKYRVAADSSIR